MKRRDFITASASAGLAVSAPGVVRAQSKKKFRWRMALAVPRTLGIWGPGMERFANKVALLTNNQLKIRVYGAGELVPALGTFDAVSSGEIQVGHAASYYWQGKVPISPFFTNVPFGMDASGMFAWLSTGGGQELWDEVMKPFGVRCLPCGTTGHQTTGWFKKEIKSTADLKGLKVRVPGLAGKVYAKAGASPVLLPGSDLYTSLATGVIDAVEWVGPYHDMTLGLHKAAPILYGTSWHEPGPVLELMINEAAWQELPPQFQEIITLVAHETSLWMRSRWETENARYLRKLSSEGKIQLKELPAEVLDTLQKHANELLKEIATTSPLAQKVYDSFFSFKEEFEAYLHWVTNGYYCNNR